MMIKYGKDLKLKLCMWIQYGGRLMPIDTVDNRYNACRCSRQDADAAIND